MKRLTIVILVMAMNAVMAAPVDRATARRVAENFWRQEEKRAVVLEDISSALSVEKLYVFETSERDGYVVVAGDDVALPILAHSGSSGFPVEGMAPAVKGWLAFYEREIAAAQEMELKATAYTRELWEALREGTPLPQAKGVKVDQLMTTRWNQSPLYNNYCPKADGEDRAVTGCVATALAQVMRYWQFPEHGIGSHSYSYEGVPDSVVHWPYGTLSADFENTTYRYDLMPDTINGYCSAEEIDAVATLSYHCGVALDMVYNPSGSAAFMTRQEVIEFDSVHYSTEIALEVIIPQYFGYAPTVGYWRRDFELSDWISMVQEELVRGRPVLYAGEASEDGQYGHCFVVDGCNQRSKFHINFGWGGLYDGYFYLDAIDPSSVMPNMSHRQSAIFGMYPPGRDGIESVEAAEVTVYPNPAREWVEVRSDGSEVLGVTVYDMRGQVVHKEEATRRHGRVNIGALPNGVYMMRVETDRGTAIKKVVKR
ncbi:MAG: C10 family peptidase [Bacteroidales bacterium]|nr:C10 family peptidase [Bacteroidales bacterium]